MNITNEENRLIYMLLAKNYYGLKSDRNRETGRQRELSPEEMKMERRFRKSARGLMHKLDEEFFDDSNNPFPMNGQSPD